MADSKVSALRFLSVPCDTLYSSWSRCGNQFYSALGARIAAGRNGAAEIGQLAFERPGNKHLQQIKAGTSWEAGITRITLDSTADSKGQSAFELLDDLDANPAAYKHTVAYKHVSAEPQATSTESNNLEPCPYRYDANKTAVHLTCSVKAFYTAPDKPMIQTTGPLGPLSVWEPHFDVTRCKPGDLEKFKEACKMFDVIAPTHVDLMKLFGAEEKEDLWGSLLKRFKDDSDSSKADKKRARALIEWHAEKLLRSGVGRRNAGTVVVRSGELGCLVATRLPGKWIKISFEWLPDYLDEFFGSMDYLEHPPAKEYLPNSPQVGTMFVGALTYGMATGWPVVEAAKRALFAATYLVQLEKCRTEKWNAKMRISKDEWERVWEQGRVTPHDLQPEPAGAAPGEAWLGHCFEWRALLWDSPGYGSRASDTPSEPTLFDRLTKLATPQ